MYETYLRLGYDKEFVKASVNNWGLDGLTIASAVVEATKLADEKTENRISTEWFQAYRDAFQEIIKQLSPMFTEKTNEKAGDASIEESTTNLSESENTNENTTRGNVPDVSTFNGILSSFIAKSQLDTSDKTTTDEIKHLSFLKLLDKILT